MGPLSVRNSTRCPAVLTWPLASRISAVSLTFLTLGVTRSGSAVSLMRAGPPGSKPISTLSLLAASSPTIDAVIVTRLDEDSCGAV